MNITRCTQQWDFMIYAHISRYKGNSESATRKEMLDKWVRPKEKEPYKSVVTDSINDAVEFTYKAGTAPSKFNEMVKSTTRGFDACVKARKLDRFHRELNSASVRAGLVTMWDYYRRRGLTKAQILGSSKKLPVVLEKMLDAVYAPGFSVHLYRIRDIWNPTTAYISQKYFGTRVK